MEVWIVERADQQRQADDVADRRGGVAIHERSHSVKFALAEQQHVAALGQEGFDAVQQIGDFRS